MPRTINHLIAICILAAPFSATAAITNGDFETGNITGWTPIGAAHADTAAIGVAPPQGTYQGYIDNTGNFSALAPAVVASLGVSGPSIAALGAGTPTTGSAISQDVTVAAGNVLTFDWNFLTDEHNEGVAYNDFAIFTISSAANFLASRDSTFFTLNLASPPPGFDGQTNYATSTYTFPSAGTYKVGFAIFNVGDAGHNSVLLLDSIAIAVPEPTAPTLLTLAALAMFSRRRQAHSNARAQEIK
jgi:hypothetical protein